MTPSRLLAELEALAWRLGIAVRIEPFGDDLLERRGGLCRVRGQALIVMDSSLSTTGRIATLTQALSAFELEGVFVPPLVRARIEWLREPERPLLAVTARRARVSAR